MNKRYFTGNPTRRYKIKIIEKLTKKFGDFIAASELTFHVEKGEIFGFLCVGALRHFSARCIYPVMQVQSRSGNARGMEFDEVHQAVEVWPAPETAAQAIAVDPTGRRVALARFTSLYLSALN